MIFMFRYELETKDGVMKKDTLVIEGSDEEFSKEYALAFLESEFEGGILLLLEPASKTGPD